MKENTQWANMPDIFSMGSEIAPYLNNCIIPEITGGVRQGSLLDVGCWDGRNTLPLARSNLFNKVVGVDVPEFAQERFQRLQKCAEEIPLLEIKAMKPGAGIDLPTESFDVVMAWRVVHNILDRDDRIEFLRRISRFVRYGGYLIVSARKHDETCRYQSQEFSGEGKNKVHISKRFDDDIYRMYYYNGEQLKGELSEAFDCSSCSMYYFHNNSFLEYELRPGLSETKQVVPCIAIVVKKLPFS